MLRCIGRRTVKHSNSVPNTLHSAVTLDTLAGHTPPCLRKSVRRSKINGIPVSALIDIGSSENFVHNNTVEQNKLTIYPDKGEVSPADVSLSLKILGHCYVNQELQGEIYHGVKF